MFYVRDFCAERRSALMREKIDEFFFLKKGRDFFYAFPLFLGQKTVLGSRGFWRRKK